MQIFSGSNPILKRYLTLFYGIALGLALVLAILAVVLRPEAPTVAATITQLSRITHTAVPTLDITQTHSLAESTALPPVPPTPNETTPSPLGVTTAELHGLQVSFWYPWTGSTGVALQSILRDFSRTNQWGITVQAHPFEGFGSLDEAVDSAITAGTPPDVLVDYGYQARRWDTSGIVADLTPYVNDPVWGLLDIEQADFYPDFWAEDLVTSSTTHQARRLGIPFYRSAYILFYNQSWAKELGYANPPATLAEFKTQACGAAQAFTGQADRSDSLRGGLLITPQPGAVLGWIYAFGGDVTAPTASGYQFNTAETRQAFETLKALQSSGCAWSETEVDPLAEFASRQALFMAGSLLDIPAQQEAFLAQGNGDHWSVIPFPSDRQPVVDTYGASLVLTSSTPARQLAAWLVIKWLIYPPNLSEWMTSIKTYPTRQSVLSYLSDSAPADSQWQDALTLLPDRHAEPSIASWDVMRWALSDAMAELLSSQFQADQIPSLLERLDSLASEISTQVH